MMTVEELKKEGAIYFEKVTDGMQHECISGGG